MALFYKTTLLILFLTESLSLSGQDISIINKTGHQEKDFKKYFCKHWVLSEKKIDGKTIRYQTNFVSGGYIRFKKTGKYITNMSGSNEKYNWNFLEGRINPTEEKTVWTVLKVSKTELILISNTEVGYKFSNK